MFKRTIGGPRARWRAWSLAWCNLIDAVVVILTAGYLWSDLEMTYLIWESDRRLRGK